MSCGLLKRNMAFLGDVGLGPKTNMPLVIQLPAFGLLLGSPLVHIHLETTGYGSAVCSWRGKKR
jgi:hypothetical protein